MKLTILMPCLNEAETLGGCITKAKAWLQHSGMEGEVLVADNGSTDGSLELAQALGARVISVAQKGYGSALFHGCMAAQGEYIIMGDADGSYDFSSLDAFVGGLKAGFDLVMGNRFRGGIAQGAMPWKNRYIGNPVLSWVGRRLFSCPANDFHCGLRGVRREAFLNMDLRTTGMEFASEMVIKASLFGMRIAEVPTTLSRDGRSRPPHLRPWRDGWRHLRFMLLFSPRWLFLIPGLITLLGSTVAYIALLFGAVRIGAVVFDIHTLFYTQSGIVLGCLAMALGVIIRIFAMREGLLQGPSWLEKIRTSPILELGGISGLFMIFSGLYLAATSLKVWSDVNFSSLVLGDLLRTVSLSTTLIMIGGILLMSSLIMGFLSLPIRGSYLSEGQEKP
ncbi:MAG: glycosyltransferase family 2 protein [Thermodesulfobacteriota bacterium]